jgi:hypothetical protein
VVNAEQFGRSRDGELLDRVHELLAFVVALGRVPLGVFVREHRAGRLEHGLGDVVLRRDHPQFVVLARGFALDQHGELRVFGGQVRDWWYMHGGPLCHIAGTRRAVRGARSLVAPRPMLPDLLIMMSTRHANSVIRQ